MESKRLDELVARFWEGACSEAEERELKEIVLYGELPAKHAELKSYMSYMDRSKDEEGLGDVFDRQVLAAIEKRENASDSFPWMKMAAGMALLVGLFFTWRSYSDPQIVPDVQEEIVITDTYEDPEVAYREVKKALMLVGNKMNQGISYAGGVNDDDLDSSEGDEDSKDLK